MRPKRRILLYCVDESATCEMRFRLDLWGFAVESCETYKAAIALSRKFFDCAFIVAVTSDDALDLAKVLKRVSPELRVIELRKKMSMVQTLADVVLFEGSGYDEVRETIRTVVARKRGPKKAIQQVAA